MPVPVILLAVGELLDILTLSRHHINIRISNVTRGKGIRASAHRVIPTNTKALKSRKRVNLFFRLFASQYVNCIFIFPPSGEFKCHLPFWKFHFTLSCLICPHNVTNLSRGETANDAGAQTGR